MQRPPQKLCKHTRHYPIPLPTLTWDGQGAVELSLSLSRYTCPASRKSAKSDGAPNRPLSMESDESLRYAFTLATYLSFAAASDACAMAQQGLPACGMRILNRRAPAPSPAQPRQLEAAEPHDAGACGRRLGVWGLCGMCPIAVMPAETAVHCGHPLTLLFAGFHL